MILAKLAIWNTARRLMTESVEMELEDTDAGASLPHFASTPDELADWILERHPGGLADVFLTMGIIIGKIEQAWGHSIGLVFHHMDCGEEQENLLYRLIMGCIGHGIFLDDDGPSGPVATGFDNAGRILCNLIEDTGKRFEASPVALDDDPIRELVSSHLCYEEETECSTTQ